MVGETGIVVDDSRTENRIQGGMASVETNQKGNKRMR